MLDTVVGSIPVLGSIFDVYFKSNNRNITLLRRHLGKAEGGRRRPAQHSPEELYWFIARSAAEPISVQVKGKIWKIQVLVGLLLS
ncbi:DUF4112 domain-containing protein [Mesorhizobium australicum]